MQTVDQIAGEIVRREGGYVNDPDDPGGATKYGVTIHSMRRLGLDLNQDGKITAADVRLLTIEKAAEIFKEHYFLAPKINQLPKSLQPSVFDMQVNAGGNAIKILQRLMQNFGQNLTVDGALGPKTCKIAHELWAQAPDHMVDAYGIARRNYYYQLADRRATSRKYARRRDGGKGGWIRRAEEFISPRFQLTDMEHQQRTASWA